MFMGNVSIIYKESEEDFLPLYAKIKLFLKN